MIKRRNKMRKSDIIKDIPCDYEKWIDNYYSNNFYCQNCGRSNKKLIKKGVPVKGLSIECENCGCKINN